MKKYLLLTLPLLFLAGCHSHPPEKEMTVESQGVTTHQVAELPDTKSLTDFEQVTVIDSLDKEREVLEDKDGAVVYIRMRGCSYCDQIEPALKMALGTDGQVPVHILDVSDYEPSQEFKEATRMQYTPWMVRLMDGKVESTYLFEEETKSQDIVLWLNK